MADYLYTIRDRVLAEIEANDALTAEELRAEAVPVLGTVVIEGGLTDGELRAAPVPVSGTVTANVTFPVTQPVSGTVAVSNFPVEADPEYSRVATTVTALGSTTIHTPASGKAVRLRHIAISDDPSDAAAPLVKVLLGGTEVFRTFTSVSLTQRITGAVNDALVIDLSVAGSIAVTAFYEEI